jgi:outer membrane protein TolC
MRVLPRVIRIRPLGAYSCRWIIGLFACSLLWAPGLRAQGAPTQPVTLPPPADEQVPAGPRLIPLADAVREALSRNPGSMVASEEIRRAEALVEQARAPAFPTLSGNALYTRLDHDRVASSVVDTVAGPVTLPPTVYAPKGQLSANVTLGLPLIEAKSWAQWSHAGDNVDVARASATDIRRQVAVAVARAYLTIVAQKRVIEAATRARDSDRAHFEFADQRFVGGVGNRIDAVRAQQLLQSDEALLQGDYSNLAKDREALGVLVGSGGPLDAEEPYLEARVDPRQAMTDAEHRTDVVVADRELKATRHAVRDAWTDYMPSLVALFEPFYWDPATITEPTTGWEAQLILTVPFYDGGLRYGQEKERTSLRDEAETRLDGTLRQARSDVRTAFEEVRRAVLALASSQQASDLARTALDLAESAYRAGASTNIEVIDAERTARDAQTDVAVAEDGVRQARLDLLAATGTFP